MATSLDPAAADSASHRRSRRWRWVAAFLIIVVCAMVAYLRTGAAVVLQQSFPAGSELILLDGDRRFDVASEWLNAGRVSRIVHLGDSVSTLVQLGILPRAHAFAEQQLLNRGVPAERLEIHDTPMNGSWGAARSIVERQRQDPEQTIVVACGLFSSRRFRWQLDQVGADGERVRVYGLPDRRFAARDWWKQRDSAKEFASALIDLVATRWAGEPTPAEEAPRFDPDEYEQRLARMLKP